MLKFTNMLMILCLVSNWAIQISSKKHDDHGHRNIDLQKRANYFHKKSPNRPKNRKSLTMFELLKSI